MIAVTLIAAVIFGGYMFLFKDKKTAGKKETVTAAEPSVDTFVADQLRILNQYSVQEGEKNVLKKSEYEWRTDPFASPKLMELLEKGLGVKTDPEEQIPREEEQILYYGYIKLGKKFLAIINGMEYETGDTIKGTQYKILSASIDAVTLRSPDASTKEIKRLDNLNPPEKKPQPSRQATFNQAPLRDRFNPYVNRYLRDRRFRESGRRTGVEN